RPGGARRDALHAHLRRQLLPGRRFHQGARLAGRDAERKGDRRRAAADDQRLFASGVAESGIPVAGSDLLDHHLPAPARGKPHRRSVAGKPGHRRSRSGLDHDRRGAMRKLKGPELKMPELKPPAFLADLYYDLRDRRLLPLIALVVVATVAVPFLMGSDAESVPALPAGGAVTLESSPEKTSKLTVVEATPGLRDYHKRLRGRAPTDPFKQLY